MTDPHLTCQQLIAFICDYLEGQLPDGQKSSFQKHLECCPCCKNYLESYQQTIRASKAACCDGADRPPQMPDVMVQAILAAQKQQGPRGDSKDSCC
jgi:anti-sigma factor RsiW